MQTAGPEKVDVALIGCGPVGAMLANLLGLCGVSVCVLDRAEAVYPLPRAIHFDDEVMRVLQGAGIADAIGPRLLASPGMKFVDAQGRLLIDWSRPAVIGAAGLVPELPVPPAGAGRGDADRSGTLCPCHAAKRLCGRRTGAAARVRRGADAAGPWRARRGRGALRRGLRRGGVVRAANDGRWPGRSRVQRALAGRGHDPAAPPSRSGRS